MAMPNKLNNSMLRSFCVDLQHGLQTSRSGFWAYPPQVLGGKGQYVSFGHQTPPIFSNFAGKTVTRLGLARSIVQGLCFLTSLIFRVKIAYHKARHHSPNLRPKSTLAPSRKCWRRGWSCCCCCSHPGCAETSTTTAAHSFRKKQNVF